jgi:hypothetical protein
LTARRFPPPWSVEELEACFVVKDRADQKRAYVYFEEEPGRRSSAKLLLKDEARRIAANIAKLPELIRVSQRSKNKTTKIALGTIAFLAEWDAKLGARCLAHSESVIAFARNAHKCNRRNSIFFFDD